jgi:hypothetical protein
MTLFEYLAVAVSIVLGLAAARLLDALPHILARGRRYWVHAIFTGLCLANLGNAWWVFWSFHSVAEWTSAEFFLVLLISGLHYSIAALLASSAAADVQSWQEYFSEIRVRFFSLGLFWMVLVSFQNWIILDLSWRHPTRFIELLASALMALGIVSASPRVHALIAILMAASVVVVAGLFLRSAPLL